MSKLLIFRTKVLLTSEEQMELEAEHDFGNIQDNDRRWLYRRAAIICSEINRVIQYNKTKTLIEMWNDAQYLVDEPFDDVVAKWQECKDAEEAMPEETGEEEEGEDDTAEEE